MNSCFCVIWLHSYVFLVCSQTQLHFFVHLFICFGESIRCLKTLSTRRHDSWSFLVFYEYFPMVWISLFTARLPNERQSHGPLREGREQNGRQTPTVAPSSFLLLFVLGTNTFVLKYFSLLPILSIVISTENIHRTLILHLFYSVKCW